MVDRSVGYTGVRDGVQNQGAQGDPAQEASRDYCFTYILLPQFTTHEVSCHCSTIGTTPPFNDYPNPEIPQSFPILLYYFLIS